MGIDPILLLLNCCFILNGILVAATSYFGFSSKKTPFDLLDHKKREEIMKKNIPMSSVSNPVIIKPYVDDPLLNQFLKDLFSKKEFNYCWPDEFNVCIIRNKDDTYNLYGTDYNIGKFSRKVADEYDAYNIITKFQKPTNNTANSIYEARLRKIPSTLNFDELAEKAKLFLQENWGKNMPLVIESFVNPYIKIEKSPLRMKFDLALEDLNVTELSPEKSGFFAWNGTSEYATVRICEDGFDPKRRAGQAYGPGEYFGTTSEISHGYCHGSNLMMVSFIIEGNHVNRIPNFCFVVKNPLDCNSTYCIPILIVNFNSQNYNSFFEMEKRFKYNRISVLFCIDFSNKMILISELKNHVSFILDNLKPELIKYSNTNLQLNYGILAFRDFGVGANQYQEMLLTENVDELKRFLLTLATIGEGNIAENIFGSLYRISNNEHIYSSFWKNSIKFLIMITNGPSNVASVNANYTYKHQSLTAEISVKNTVEAIWKNKAEFIFAKILEGNVSIQNVLKNSYDNANNVYCSPMSVLTLGQTASSTVNKTVNVNGNNHYIFMLDDSGSMSGGPWNDLMKAYNNFLNIKSSDNTGEYISVLTHENIARVHINCQPIKSAKREIPFSSGGNDFNVAFQAVDPLIKLSNLTPIVIFMSDGGGGDPSIIVNKLMSDYRSIGIKIFSVAFGSNVNKIILDKIASIGGTGSSNEALNATELRNAFEKIISETKITYTLETQDRKIINECVNKYKSRLLKLENIVPQSLFLNTYNQVTLNPVINDSCYASDLFA
jgi:uncharacterized protein YegL